MDRDNKDLHTAIPHTIDTLYATYLSQDAKNKLSALATSEIDQIELLNNFLANFAQPKRTHHDQKRLERLHNELTNTCLLFPKVIEPAQVNLLEQAQRPKNTTLPTLNRVLNQITAQLVLDFGVQPEDVTRAFTQINSHGLTINPNTGLLRPAFEAEAPLCFGPFANLFNQAPFNDPSITWPTMIDEQPVDVPFNDTSILLKQTITLTEILSHGPISSQVHKSEFTKIATRHKNRVPSIPSLSKSGAKNSDGKLIVDFIQHVNTTTLPIVKQFLAANFPTQTSNIYADPAKSDVFVQELVAKYWRNFGGVYRQSARRLVSESTIWPTMSGLSLHPAAMIPSFYTFCVKELRVYIADPRLIGITEAFPKPGTFNRHEGGRQASRQPDPGPKSRGEV